MDQETTQGAGTLGMISIGTGILGLLGQGCCCVPIISLFAMLIVPVLIMTSIVTGGLGMTRAGPERRLSMMGLALGIFDAIFLISWYVGFMMLYGGLLVLGNL